MKICSDAGIDLTKKNIWRDRTVIINNLPEGTLKTWLKSFDQPKAEAKPAASATPVTSVAPVTPAIPAAAPTASIRFKGGSCRLDNVDLRPMFAPADMADTQKAFMVNVRYQLDGTNADVLDVLYEEGRFVAPDGTTYKAGVATLNEKSSLYSLIVAVPKNVDVLSLKFVFNGQTLALK
jgi:hypothetical protein